MRNVGKREQQTKAAQDSKEQTRVMTHMKYDVVENSKGKYLHCTSSESLIQGESDALDIISMCAEHDANAVLLDGAVLSDEFVRLRTGIAGTVLQKFIAYDIKSCVVIKGDQVFPERFKEMMSEYKSGDRFRIFTNLEEAEQWLQV